MLEWPLSGDAISARGDETLARGLDETNPERRHVSQGGPVWSSHVMHGRHPLPPRGSSVRVPGKKSEWKSTNPAPIWRDGGWGTKSALDHVACAFGSAQNCLI
jgi:hypothetical protein